MIKFRYMFIQCPVIISKGEGPWLLNPLRSLHLRPYCEQWENADVRQDIRYRSDLSNYTNQVLMICTNHCILEQWLCRPCKLSWVSWRSNQTKLRQIWEDFQIQKMDPSRKNNGNNWWFLRWFKSSSCVFPSFFLDPSRFSERRAA